jgi:hypothetical protein
MCNSENLNTGELAEPIPKSFQAKKIFPRDPPIIQAEVCVRQLGGRARDRFFPPPALAAAIWGWSARSPAMAPAGAIERQPIEASPATMLLAADERK